MRHVAEVIVCLFLCLVIFAECDGLNDTRAMVREWTGGGECKAATP